MSKVSKFYNNLVNKVNSIPTVEAKLLIGDSINNNRALTVGQTIRVLSEVRGGKVLAKNLDSVYNELRPFIINTRQNDRSDAVDINEFFSFYESEILNGNTFAKRFVSSQLSL